MIFWNIRENEVTVMHATIFHLENSTLALRLH